MTSRILLRDIYHLVTAAGQPRRRGVDLLIEGGRVADIGERLPRGDAEVIDASTKLVMPGLVNTHHHMFQTLQRNIPVVQNSELFQWLTGLYPIWRHLTPETVRISTLLACAELLKTGCTTTSDHHYLFPASAAADLISVQLASAAQAGIRFCATRGSMSQGQSKGGLPPDSVVQDEQTILADSEALIQKRHDPGDLSMSRIALAPCAPFSVSAALLRSTAELARKYDVRLHTHLAETQDELDYCLEHFHCRPLELMQQVGWIGPDVWYAHGIHFNDEELSLLASTGTGIAHCPCSNMRLGSGIARVPEMLRAGVVVGLAVDGSASNDSSDMLGELRSCLMLHRVLGGAAAITVDQVFDMATSGGAKLLGWPNIGKLDIGCAADVVLVEMDRLDYAGALSDPLAAVMFCGMSHGVHTVIVNGQVVLADGVLTSIDEHDLRQQANAEARRMMELGGHDVRWML